MGGEEKGEELAGNNEEESESPFRAPGSRQKIRKAWRPAAGSARTALPFLPPFALTFPKVRPGGSAGGEGKRGRGNSEAFFKRLGKSSATLGSESRKVREGIFC